MSVYVDAARHRYGRLLLSHLVADTDAELNAMAAVLGLRPEWKQRGHFDISESKRVQAIQHGALPVTSREAAKIRRTALEEAGSE